MGKRVITIGLMGDVMIGRLVDEILSEVPPSYLWGDMLPLLNSTDLNLINLEAALTYSTHRVPKVFNFKAEPKKVRTLIEGHIDVVNLANNHVLDYDEQGLMETLDTLDKVDIQHVGAGKNRTQAMASAILKRKGITVGILGCTDNEETWNATDEKPGTFYLKIGDVKAVEEAIHHLRKKVDVLIVTIHWGPNVKERPSASFRSFAHRLIELGVDIIHGHSAHIFQGVEVYQKKLILYDTGDFVDDYTVDLVLRNDRSFFFIVEATKEGPIALRLIPTLITQFQVNRSTGKEAEETLLRMQKLSAEMHTFFQQQNLSLSCLL